VINILIFGGSGFLGRHLRSHFEKFENDVFFVAPSSWTFDLTRKHEDALYYVKDDPPWNTKFDYIFLCTNWFRPGNFNVSADEFINNNIINSNALWYWKNIQSQATLVTFGSDAAYDENEEPYEENYLKGFPNPSYYSYGLTKRFLYQGMIEIHKQTQSPYLHFPLISIFGANFNLDDEHLMHAIVKKIVNAKMLNQKASFWGNGMQTREVSFVEDIVENITSITLKHQRKNDIFNLGSEKRFTIRDMVEQVCQYVGYDIADVEFDASKTVGINSKRLHSNKAKDICMDYKDTPMDVCIQRVYDYYYQNKFGNS
jgi:UDP-glucose 4-epimerase